MKHTLSAEDFSIKEELDRKVKQFVSSVLRGYSVSVITKKDAASKLYDMMEVVGGLIDDDLSRKIYKAARALT